MKFVSKQGRRQHALITLMLLYYNWTSIERSVSYYHRRHEDQPKFYLFVIPYRKLTSKARFAGNKQELKEYCELQYILTKVSLYMYKIS